MCSHRRVRTPCHTLGKQQTYPVLLRAGSHPVRTSGRGWACPSRNGTRCRSARGYTRWRARQGHNRFRGDTRLHHRLRGCSGGARPPRQHQRGYRWFPSTFQRCPTRTSSCRVGEQQVRWVVRPLFCTSDIHMCQVRSLYVRIWGGNAHEGLVSCL